MNDVDKWWLEVEILTGIQGRLQHVYDREDVRVMASGLRARKQKLQRKIRAAQREQ